MEEFRVHRFFLVGQIFFAAVLFALIGIGWAIAIKEATLMAFVIPAFVTLLIAAYFYRVVFTLPIRITVDNTSSDVSVFSRRSLVGFSADQVRVLEIERGPNLHTRLWLHLSSGERIFFRTDIIPQFPAFVHMLVAVNPGIDTRGIPAHWLRAPQPGDLDRRW